MKYFTNFPIIEYEFKDRKLEMTDVFVRPDISTVFSPQVTGNFTTFIQDGWSPDRASREVYNDDNYFWFLLLQNNIIDFYQEWPASYDYWLLELSRVYSGDTFFVNTKPDVQIGDIVAKSSSETFDKENSGVIVNFNSFFRSFDVVPIKGNISEGESFKIMRKSGSGFTTIGTFTLYRKEPKLNSAGQFYIKNSLGKNVPVSPYSDIWGSSLVSDSVEDILSQLNCILYNYITRQDGRIFYDTFSRVKQKEWLFKKNIKTIPVADLNILDNAYAEFFIANEE